ncbi:hypothetical protein BZA05DRAFT_30200 [Tricharina praecox]|uniref:uncharacterized protein n=1 Tax=Tricharina praecox TaxID=43433 RepID=UPI00221F9384|nr:uncharacterized protein BZA05DRAFT_30200 [Tricharina praecox]KAI5853460.1 hypothetical protein BZA05DRAFT_30200 [Tricharina praecox]
MRWWWLCWFWWCCWLWCWWWVSDRVRQSIISSLGGQRRQAEVQSRSRWRRRVVVCRPLWVVLVVLVLGCLLSSTESRRCRPRE